MLKNIEFFTGEDLRLHFDQVRRVTPKILSILETYGTILTYPAMQAYINNYRRELPVVLLNSLYNKLKSTKRLKTYNASLSDAAAIEDHEDASI